MNKNTINTNNDTRTYKSFKQKTNPNHIYNKPYIANTPNHQNQNNSNNNNKFNMYSKNLDYSNLNNGK